jgi:transposase
MGCAVRLVLHSRRFFCLNPNCQRKIFTLIAFALGGEAGKRLAAGMGLITNPDTLLQLIRGQAEQPSPTPRILGVDDFSFCRRRTYGTILIDLERKVPIEILPDRDGPTLTKWLVEHPGVEIISRDRGGPYADGAKAGAPEAQQVADRWHLLANLSEALKPFFLRKQAHLKALVTPPCETFSEEEVEQLPPWYEGHGTYTKKQKAISNAHHQAHVDLYRRVHEMRRQGAALQLIARQVGLSRTTVNKYLSMEQPPERKRGRPGKPAIGPYKDYIIARWNAGVRNAQQVYRELLEMGYTGSDQPIQRYFVQFRQKKDYRKFKQVDPSQETPVKDSPKRPPSARQVAHWITFKEDQRLEWQQRYLKQLCEADQEIAEANKLMVAFTTMLRERKGEPFDAWLAEVDQQGIAELKSFAASLKKDYDAV